MSEYSELVKRLCGTWTMDAVQGDNPQLTELEISDEPAPICQEAAQAIERLEGEKEELERRATFIEHEHPQKLEPHFSAAMGLLTQRKAFRKGEIAQLLAEQMQQLAEARAEIERWKGIAEGAAADLRRYARDEMPERRRISAELYEKQIKEALAAPVPSTGEAERHTAHPFEALLAPIEPSRPWQHNYAVCKYCGKTEAACLAAQKQEQEG